MIQSGGGAAAALVHPPDDGTDLDSAATARAPVGGEGSCREEVGGRHVAIKVGGEHGSRRWEGSVDRGGHKWDGGGGVVDQ